MGVLEGLLPCPALVRAAMILLICRPCSAVPSPESVASMALALTLSWISSFSFLPYEQQPSTTSRRFWGCCMSIGWSPVCVSRLCGKGGPWSAAGPQDPSFFWGIVAWFDWGSLPALWQRKGPSQCCLTWLYKNSASRHRRRLPCQKWLTASPKCGPHWW